MLALLALAVFPVLAHAGGIPQYEVNESETGISREPVPKGKPSTEDKSQGKESQAKAHGSEATGMNSEVPSEEGGSSQKKTGNTPADGEGNSGGETGESGGKSGKNSKPGDKVGPSEEVAEGESEANGVPVAGKNDNGGGGSSSPVVPILIAVIVLAAISIGVVIYRQRKGGTGPDGRVSSPNAG